MNFTNSPFERMMKEIPRAYPPAQRKPPAGSSCRGCSYWQSAVCFGTCYKKLTSSQLGPKLAGSRANG